MYHNRTSEEQADKAKRRALRAEWVTCAFQDWARTHVQEERALGLAITYAEVVDIIQDHLEVTA